MIDPIKPETISAVLGPFGPIENVRANWPHVERALDKYAIDSHPTRIAAAATIAVETGRFSPIRERGGPAYFLKLYEANPHEAKNLGNCEPGDGAKFCGRGYIQITGRTNYTNYGRAIGVDLASNPDLALDPENAAHVLAIYFRDHKIGALAQAGNWEAVRRRVNGGLDGWDRFAAYVAELSKILPMAQAAAAGVIGDVQT